MIDNTPPRITGLAATRSGNKLEVRWHAADALNNIAKAEYSLDGGDWTVVAPTTKLSDSMELDYSCPSMLRPENTRSPCGCRTTTTIWRPTKPWCGSLRGG